MKEKKQTKTKNKLTIILGKLNSVLNNPERLNLRTITYMGRKKKTFFTYKGLLSPEGVSVKRKHV